VSAHPRPDAISGCLAVAVGAVLVACVSSLVPAPTQAQGRELASPLASGARPVDPTALPPAPERGMVPVVFEAVESRALVITQRLRRRDVTLCTAPCATWLRPARLRLGVGDAIAPRWTSERLRIEGPSTVEIHYVDNALTRGIGFVVLAASLVTLGGAAFDFVDQGPTDAPAATAVVAGLALGVSFGLFFVGDGVDIRVHPGVEPR